MHVLIFNGIIYKIFKIDLHRKAIIDIMIYNK